MALCSCEKCGHSMDSSNFYTSKNLEKYPDGGKLKQCKKCITMHINNWESSTFLWILKEVDVPFIQEEWDILLERYSREGAKKPTGMSILGRYLSKMKLNQWSKYNWDDTQKLREEIDQRKGIVKSQEDYLSQGIYKAINDGEISEDYAKAGLPNDFDELEKEFGGQAPQYPTIELDNNLTLEDRTYLTIKWGKLYKPDEWVKLEQLYTDITNSFDIQTATHLDYLKFICKTSLKMNQAIDIGDVEGFQKLAKTYDSLMKSAKFTAAQNKADSGEFVDSVGELVALCEEKGFIPRYHTDEPTDIVDTTLKDFKNYTYKLVTEEMGLGNQIESALQQMQREENKEEGQLDESDEYLNPDSIELLDDTDYEEFYDELEDQVIKDEKLEVE